MTLHPQEAKAPQMTEHQESISDATASELFRLLVENVQDYAIFVMDSGGRVRSWNPGAERLLGYSESEVIGHPADLFFTPDDVQGRVPQQQMATAVQTGRDEDARWHVRKNGSRFWSAGTITPLWDEKHDLRGFAKIMRDRTTQKRSDDALKYAERVVDTVREPLLVLDGDLRVKSANRSFYRAFQVSPSDIENRLIYHLADHLWDIPQLRTLLEEILPQHTSFDNFEVEHEFGALGRKVMMLNARRFQQEGNQTELILLAIEDITERRRAEKDRQEIETRFTSLVKNIKDHAIFTMDPDGRITSWNVEAERILGYSEAEILGEPFSLIFTPEDQQIGLPDQEFRLAREAGRAVDERWHVRKDGVRFWALGIVTPAQDASGKLTGFSKILRDMTEQKRLENELEQTHEKTETTVWERTAELRMANDELRKEIAERQLVEEELRRTSVLLRAVTEGTTDAVFVKDRAGRYLLFNEAAGRFVGRPPAEVIGKDDAELFDSASARRVMERDQRVMASGQATTEEEQLTAAGVSRTYLATKAPYRNAAGDVVGMIGISRDITDRKQVEEAVRASEMLLASAFDYTHIAMVFTDSDNRFIRVNAAFAGLFGYSQPELLTMSMADITHPDYLAESYRRRDLLAAGATNFFQIEKRYLHHDGRVLWGLTNVSLVRDPAGRPLFYVGQVQDITDRKQVEEALRRSEARKAAVLEVSLDAIITMDHEGKVVEFNSAAEQLFGHSRADLIGKEMAESVIPPHLREKHRQGLANYLVTGEGPILGRRLEMSVVRADGTEFPIELAVVRIPGDGQPLFTGFIRDVTQRKQAERRLRAQHDSTRALAESPSVDAAIPVILESVCKSLSWACAAFWRVDPQANRLGLTHFWDDHLSDLNPFQTVSQEKTFSSGEGLPGRTWAIREAEWVPDVIEDVSFHRANVAARCGLHSAHAFPIMSGRDVIGVMEFFSRRVERPDEELSGMMMAIGSQMGQFIERRQTEVALHKEQEFLKAVLENAQDLIVACDALGVLTFFNRAARALHGKEEKSVLAERWAEEFDLYRADGKTRLTKEEIPLYRALHGEKVRDVEIVIRPESGVAHTLLSTGQTITDGRGKLLGAVVVMHDITERKRLENQFHQAQKMEAVGQLAGGVAHDFNNLLTVICGYSEVLLGLLPAPDPTSEMIQEILKAGERAAGLTRQLLAFSRKQIIQPKVVDLNTLVADVSKLLRRMIGEDVSLVTVLAPRLGRVKADPGQIEQVFMNLAVNARDAMPQGGKLTIETANAELDQSYKKFRPEVATGRYVQLTISDSGCGMSEDVKARLFEPFFSTKEPGKGTGLGLATVYGIVKQSGGYIYVYSELGRGTTFKIYLPLIDDAVPSGKSHADSKPMLKGDEVILLVEDEDTVRSFARYTLQMQGYTVLEASEGEAALRIAEQHPGKIHLLLTDVVMPRMGGRQVAEQLVQARPGIKVLYLSGYTDDAVVRHGILEAEVAFLQKPFTPSTLIQKVRAVLDE